MRQNRSSGMNFGPFVDMKKEEWCTKVLLDKYGRVYFASVSSKFAATCHEYICLMQIVYWCKKIKRMYINMLQRH